MALKPDEINEIRRLKAEGKTVEEIENKTGYSHTSIVKYTKDPQQPSPPSKTTPPLGKNAEIPQAQTDQITLHKILTAIEKTQHPTTNNITNSYYQRLEQRVNQLEQAKQTQEPTNDSHLKKQENTPKSEEMKQQQVQPTVSLSSPSDFQQLPKTDDNQMVVPSQDLENESPDIIDHLYNNLPGIIKGLIETKPLWSKLGNDFGTFLKTGFFPSEDYIKYAKERNAKEENKKPISGDVPKPVLIHNPNPPPKTNTETAYIIPLGSVEPIQESPPLQKTITEQHTSGKSDSNQHQNDEENQKNYLNINTSGVPCSGAFLYNCSGFIDIRSQPEKKS